ncbi:hypothetical protein BB559_003445 [Furculomyces boomerangus]|uniref:Uncharacterized protein n=2 Tax=Harpellales TaxID=61421 RepID=A0A2T9YL97_9FUNG|nr:hypothetical protein BB559_003445 [Furculomyces boomerangus]PWA03652.1 hypothetical protein BB558_000191 [Smittium angustum]
MQAHKNKNIPLSFLSKQHSDFVPVFAPKHLLKNRSSQISSQTVVNRFSFGSHGSSSRSFTIEHGLTTNSHNTGPKPDLQRNSKQSNISFEGSTNNQTHSKIYRSRSQSSSTLIFSKPIVSELCQQLGTDSLITIKQKKIQRRRSNTESFSEYWRRSRSRNSIDKNHQASITNPTQSNRKSIISDNTESEEFSQPRYNPERINKLLKIPNSPQKQTIKNLCGPSFISPASNITNSKNVHLNVKILKNEGKSPEPIHQQTNNPSNVNGSETHLQNKRDSQISKRKVPSIYLLNEIENCGIDFNSIDSEQNIIQNNEPSLQDMHQSNDELMVMLKPVCSQSSNETAANYTPPYERDDSLIFDKEYARISNGLLYLKDSKAKSFSEESTNSAVSNNGHILLKELKNFKESISNCDCANVDNLGHSTECEAELQDMYATYRKYNKSVMKMHDMFSGRDSKCLGMLQYGDIEGYNKKAKLLDSSIESQKKQLEFAKYLILASESLKDLSSFTKFKKLANYFKRKIPLFGKSDHNARVLELAIYWINRLSKTKLPEAMFIKANWTRKGEFGIKKSNKNALTIYKEASMLGHGPSALEAANYYEYKQKYKEALKWYIQASHLNEPVAAYRLSVAHLIGELGVVPNLRYAYAHFKVSADLANKECPYGAYCLAMMHLGEPPVSIDTSSEIPYDPNRALELLLKSASLEYPPSYYQLGRLYESGEHGVQINYGFAIDNYKLASNQGNQDALYSLARIYVNGIEGVVEKDYKLAFNYCENAAIQGLQAAELLMGWFYDPEVPLCLGFKNQSKSDFPQKSLIYAREWYRRAAASGSTEAATWLGNKKIN